MWQQARRSASLAFWGASEIILQAVGRRPPYGILKLDVSGDLSEAPADHRLFALPQRGRMDYLDLVAMLRWAREDDQLRAVFIHCGTLRAGWAKIQELHRCLRALRSAGKSVWVCLTQAGMAEYLFASAADRIILTPAGTLDVTGLSSEVTFISGTLRKLGIEAELVQMGKYKSAAETFTRDEMSEAHREMVESLLQDLYEQIVDDIGAGRRLEARSVRELLDRGPFVAREARSAGLVDDVLYADEAEQQLRAACQDAAVIERSDYIVRRGRAVRRAVLRSGGPAIGLLHITGTLKTGESLPGPDGASASGAASLGQDLKELRERHDIAAVVLRISSPGGSGLASDLIWHEVARLRESKPVVVSFGDVAASGGYYVGVAGQPVIAEGGSVTGSIGVLAGKALLRGLYDHIGVTKQVVSRGRHAALYSDYVPLGDEDRELLRSEAESFYTTFVDKVAAGRKLSHEAVGAAAQGRVWTGRQALSLGLIDQLGGVQRALDEAKVLAGPKTSAPLEGVGEPRAHP
jgi:protease-4